MKRTVLLIGLLTVVAAGAMAAVAADDKTPDFSGTWKLDTAKSDFGQMPPPDSVTLTIDHKEPKLKVKNTTKGGMRGDQESEANYTTDGKESTNTMGPMESKTTAKWDGKKLVMNTKASFQGNDVTITQTWDLSEDGKTLTQKQEYKSPMGEGSAKLVFNRE